MEWETLLKIIEPVVLGVLGYIAGVLKMLHNKSEAISTELKAHRVEVAEKYLPRHELVTLKMEMKALEDRLDKRFDRMEHWMGRRFDVIMEREDNSTHKQG